MPGALEPLYISEVISKSMLTGSVFSSMVYLKSNVASGVTIVILSLVMTTGSLTFFASTATPFFEPSVSVHLPTSLVASNFTFSTFFSAGLSSANTNETEPISAPSTTNFFSRVMEQSSM